MLCTLTLASTRPHFPHSLGGRFASVPGPSFHIPKWNEMLTEKPLLKRIHQIGKTTHPHFEMRRNWANEKKLLPVENSWNVLNFVVFFSFILELFAFVFNFRSEFVVVFVFGIFCRSRKNHLVRNVFFPFLTLAYFYGMFTKRHFKTELKKKRGENGRKNKMRFTKLTLKLHYFFVSFSASKRC